MAGIAVAHSIFNVLCTALLLPQSKLLEKLVIRLVPDDKLPDTYSELDERLLATPPLALERCRMLAADMAATAVETLRDGLRVLDKYDPEIAARILEGEEATDHFEDILGTYLVKLSTSRVTEADSAECAGLLKLIGDFERIADHGKNLLESAEELKQKELSLTKPALAELKVICNAVNEVVTLAYDAFCNGNMESAAQVEPLEQVIDQLKEALRTRHILRLQKGQCSIEAGFVWSDLLTGLERTSDHCSNIAGCLFDMAEHNLNVHESVRVMQSANKNFGEQLEMFTKKYTLPVEA